MNATANGSSSWSCSFNLMNSTAAKTGKTIALSLILVVSLVGNSLIGIIVYKTPNLRKPINFLIANMAMSDLLYPIFLFPSRLTRLHLDEWLIGGFLGQALCKLPSFLADASTLVSVQSLILITVDRFQATVVPLRSPLISRKFCPFFILATWIVAMAVYSPYFIAFQLVEYPEGMKCKKQQEVFGETAYSNYILAVAIIFFYIPFVLFLLLYSIMLIKLKQQAHPGEQSANIEVLRKRRNKNVLKTAIAIVLVFMFCWLPFFTNLLLFSFAPENSRSCGFLMFLHCSLYMAFANCAINPFVCLIFSSNYRQGLKKLMTFN